MQIGNYVQVIGILILVLGLLLIIIGMFASSNNDELKGIESDTRGIILLGPIPIILGTSRRMQILLCFIGVVLTVIILILFQP